MKQPLSLVAWLLMCNMNAPVWFVVTLLFVVTRFAIFLGHPIVQTSSGELFPPLNANWYLVALLVVYALKLSNDLVTLVRGCPLCGTLCNLVKLLTLALCIMIVFLSCCLEMARQYELMNAFYILVVDKL